MKQSATIVATVAGLAAGGWAVSAGCGKGSSYGEPRFEDVPPETSGLAFFHELPGGTLDNLMKSAMGGVALIDFDADGKVDVFCVNGGWDDLLAGKDALKPAQPAGCRLFRNLGGMRFEDVTQKAGISYAGFALGACVGDVDGDGRPDLFVSAYGAPALLRNRGDGTFEDVAAKSGIPPGFYAGAAFLDYDRDGVHDLFVGQYVDPFEGPDVDLALTRPGFFPPPGAYKPQPARLFHGRGDGTFEDVTQKAGVATPGKAMGVLATDIDSDGWMDVFVANDAMPAFLWRNQGDGTFADAAGRLNVAVGGDGEPRAGMGVTAADLNGDGRLDYLVPDTTRGVVHVARARDFVDRANDWGLGLATRQYIGWADVTFDAENDGRPDVFKVQGSVRRLDEPHWSYVVRNRGPHESGGMEFVSEVPELADGTTHEQAEPLAAPLGQVRMTGRSGVAADFDDDGREDLLAVGLMAPARLMRNVTTPVGHWVRLRLEGKTNKLALGARVLARAKGRVLLQEVSGSTGYISAPDLRLRFGLGDATELEDVVVRWPGGKEEHVGSLAADKDHVIREK
jgi:hypothetical protein